ncbi:hypothetical protein HZB69_04630 [Candidatus Amesbacteria bacterium]|nr:hypothetical protein [Candidatus Amesbacteria bacterium]
MKRIFLTLLFVGLAFYLGTRYQVPKLKTTPIPTPIISQNILPERVDLGISWGDVIVKMVQTGAIDKEKFLKRHPEAEQLLSTSNNANIVVTQENSALILNLLWPLGITNKAKVLSEGIMGTKYKDQIGSFASTGGWTLGSKDGGKLFNSQSLIKLTTDQEELIKKISANIYRPCCGNSTAFPDCNHGAGMLGFIELAVVAGMPEENIYKKALVINSYWFPQTYTELAVFFKAKKNTNWKDVNPVEVLGEAYSSGRGYGTVSKQLQDEGLTPQVKSGGSCGV